jgi:hypothetical protein
VEQGACLSTTRQLAPGLNGSTDRAFHGGEADALLLQPVARYHWRYLRRVAMTLRLDDQETDALRRRAELEGRSMQEVARQAVRDYIERTSKRELLDRVLDEELPRYAEALERLGQ